MERSSIFVPDRRTCRGKPPRLQDGKLEPNFHLLPARGPRGTWIENGALRRVLALPLQLEAHLEASAAALNRLTTCATYVSPDIILLTALKEDTVNSSDG